MNIKKRLIMPMMVVAASSGFAAADINDTIEKSYDFDSNGTISLSNVNGNVSISACDCQQVRLTANVSASDQETRDRIKVIINASDSRLSVETKYENNNNHRNNGHSKVVYHLSVPNNVSLDSIELVNGDLKIERVAGELDADLVNGDLTSDGMTSSTEVSLVNGDMNLSFANLDNAKKIKLESVNGSIIVNLPSDANVDVSAETVSGSISNEFGLNVHEGKYVGSDMRGVLGDGSVRLSMDNVNGKIKLKSL
jgi:DUF4097 and DUF4098 domain-containing protein YvlB